MDWLGFPNNVSWLKLVEFFLPKILFAIACGAIVGSERELKGKPAGIKTNTLICLGAAIYTALSVLIAGSGPQDRVQFGDPGRIAAQIVSGIGFLGGGVIIQARGTIVGLTTAATIWVIAALGIMIGLGYGWLAVVLSVTLVGMLILFSQIEERLLRRARMHECTIVWQLGASDVRAQIYRSLAQNDLMLDDFELNEVNGQAHVRLKYHGTSADQKRFLAELWRLPGIREVKNS